ncbi:MAG: AAA domain-containing protein, partial [Gammaproteobacteria bacterium]|nr:AAA domain-containing protein [Gammaproteobacteria bacterium]
MLSTTLLVIDADEQRRCHLKDLLEFSDYDDVITADSRDWQQQVASADGLLAVLLGGCRSDAEFQQVLSGVRAWGEVPILLLADKGSDSHFSADIAVDALTVLHYPLRYRQLNSALQRATAQRDGKAQARGERSPELFRSLVGNSRSVVHVRQMIKQVAESEATVLILGESGTGKEVVARNLHYYSSRREKPFVPINCGAIPADLLESELFGHEKGAFTGAISTRQGRFEMAEGGTLFLDEIGDMSLPMQVKLLRVLQERSFERVGSNKT